MNRIYAKFAELYKKKKKAFIAYITAGDPTLEITQELVPALEAAGVDMVELGIPFSDPLADGPTIQAASQRALQGGVTMEKIFQMVTEVRKKTQIPLIFMTYYNPVFHYGEELFVTKAKEIGMDGIIVPDLPPHEAKTLIQAARQKEIAIPFFLSPTTSRERMKSVIDSATGFIYYVSLTGVTGARQELPAALRKDMLQVKKLTSKPLCVGFGVSSPEQIRSLSEIADGIIVGSAIVKEIEKHKEQKDLVQQVTHFVAGLTSVLQ